MILFDIGAVLFLTGLIWIVWFLIKRLFSVVIVSIVVSLIGGLLMLIAHYIVMGNTSIFDKYI